MTDTTGPSTREQQLLLQLDVAKEAYRLSGSDSDRQAKHNLADKIREIRARNRQGRTDLVGGDAVRIDD